MKTKISKLRFRALLTDTQPYEIPLIHSNDRLLALCEKDATGTLPELLRVLLNGTIKSHPKNGAETRPLRFFSAKAGGGTRSLALPHPSSQIRMADAFATHSGMIIQACSRSSNSLRAPSRIASYYFEARYADHDTTKASLATDSNPEGFDEQAKVASTYFSYRGFSPIYKFFRSSAFSRLEAKNTYLLHLDVSNCFDSIYTHSVCWAVRGKQYSKKHRKGTFEAHLDEVARDSNWGETHGILIGPEFSRVFAEIILQSVDLTLERKFSDANLEIEFRRYLDDFFVFGKSREDLARAEELCREALGDVNLHINNAKTKIIERPMTSQLYVARDRAVGVMSEFFAMSEAALSTDSRIATNAADFSIRSIRQTARTLAVSYADLASPCLAKALERLRFIHRRLDDPISAPNVAQKIVELIIQTLHTCHFLTSTDVRMATTHKLIAIYCECIRIGRAIPERLIDVKLAIRSGALETLHLALSKSSGRAVYPELLNLILAIDELTADLPGGREDVIEMAWPGISSGTEACFKSLTYFEIATLMRVTARKRRFRSLREKILRLAGERVRSYGDALPSEAEGVFLLFDLISHPDTDPELLVSLLHGLNDSIGINVKKHTKSEWRSLIPALKKQLGFSDWNTRGADGLIQLVSKRELRTAYD